MSEKTRDIIEYKVFNIHGVKDNTKVYNLHFNLPFKFIRYQRQNCTDQNWGRLIKRPNVLCLCTEYIFHIVVLETIHIVDLFA